MDMFGIDVSRDGHAIIFLKLHERYGYASREFDSLSAAYQGILGNVRGITREEDIFGAYKPREANLMSPLVGDREDWVNLVGLPVSN